MSLYPGWLLRVSFDTSQRFRAFPAVMGGVFPSGTIVPSTRAAPKRVFAENEAVKFLGGFRLAHTVAHAEKKPHVRQQEALRPG